MSDRTPPHPTVEKDYGDMNNGNHLGSNVTQEQALHRIRTTGSISISPELFEKIYLSPQNKVSGDLRKTFGNPTPLGLIGFLICLSPLACDLMGWRGTGGPGVGAAGTGTYYFFGGLLLMVAAVGEWILGNTFPFVVFGSFAAFWLGFAATLQPAYNAFGAYSTDQTNPAEGIKEPAFYASYAFFFLAMALMCFVFLICSVRTNVAFFVIFLSLTIAFCCLAGAYWEVAKGNAVLAGKLQKGAGGACFVTCAAGWWIFVAIMLASLNFPFSLPVGDLSHIVKGASERKKLQSEMA